MPSRSRSRKSSRSSAKSPFKSASILEQGGQPALRHEDTAAPSPSNTASQVEILVSSTAQPESPHLFHPSDPRSPLAGNATSATEAGASIKLTQSDASSLKSDSIHKDQPSFQDEDTVPTALAQDEIEDVPRTPQPGSAQLPRPSLPGYWHDGNDPSATATAEPAVDDPVEPQSQAESAGVRTNPSARGQRERLPHKRFGLNTEQRRGQPAQGGLPMNYKQKYPEDPIYKETEENARVFHVYNDESQLFDNDMIGEAGDSLDILLVFAGLFASVLTTFVAQTSQSLSPDKTEISNSLLREMISLQRAQENRTSFASIPAADMTFTASRSDILVNSLWFISLALSLSTALLAVIAKQWLRQYSSFISGSPRERALIRQFRYDGLEKWRVRLIIGLLPTILHISLFLFLAGLFVFLLPLNNTLARVIAGITGFLCGTYTITNTLPLIFIQCPYRTPLSEIINSLWGYTKFIVFSICFIIIFCIAAVLVSVPTPLLFYGTMLLGFGDPWILRNKLISAMDTVPWPSWNAHLKNIERARAEETDECGRPLGIARTLMWLYQTTSDISADSIISEAVGSVSHPLLLDEGRGAYRLLRRQWRKYVPRICAGELLSAEDERIVERIIRGAFVRYSRLEGGAETIHCQAHSTMLMIAAYNRRSTLHTEDRKTQDLLPNLVFSFVAERDELAAKLEAPAWIWWSLLTQAAGAMDNWYGHIQQTIEIGKNTPHINSHREEWLRQANVPSTLRCTIRERMISTYCDSVGQRIESPIPLHALSEFYVARADDLQEKTTSPFSTLSLATFLYDNFAQFTDFWLETGDIQQSSTIDNLVSS